MGTVDGTVIEGTVSLGKAELVGVTDDSVGLDTDEILARGGKTTGVPGGDGPGIE